VAYAKRLLDEIGFGGERLEMYNMSAAMGPRFAEVAREMTEKIRKLGPSPIKKNAERPAESAERKEPITKDKIQSAALKEKNVATKES
jgi:hypothetical protein